MSTINRQYPAFHVVAKPIGALCNLDCQYCYYLQKEQYYDSSKMRMQPELLERYISQYIEAQQGEEVHFLWQGGEPTLLGLEYFELIARLQLKHRGEKKIHNALQTNGTLLDDHWCRFFKSHDYLLGISLDGPQELHDAYRTTKGGRGTHADVMRGLKLAQEHGVEFNLLAAVHAHNEGSPLVVYEFLKSVGAKHIQFLPVVERWESQTTNLASPRSNDADVTPWSVNPTAYGKFLIAVFDQWLQHDVGRVFVQLFDVALESWLGIEPSLCVFRETCGSALAIEHNGDVYACDHFVFPEYLQGNLQTQELVQIVESRNQHDFGDAKRDQWPDQCKRCDVLFACRGECPKNRFSRSVDGQPGLNYLCAGYLEYFHHIDPYMKRMAQVIRGKQSDL